MKSLRTRLLLPSLAALASTAFTNAPTVPAIAADTTWEAVQAEFQNPQDATGRKVAADEDSNTLLGWNDLAQTSWPGLSTVGGLATLPNSPLGGGSGSSNLQGGNNNPTPVTPVNPWVPPLTPGSVMPAAPNQPLSQYQP